MSTETDARIIIDRLLREADRDIEDKAQVSAELAAAPQVPARQIAVEVQQGSLDFGALTFHPPEVGLLEVERFGGERHRSHYCQNNARTDPKPHLTLRPTPKTAPNLTDSLF